MSFSLRTMRGALVIDLTGRLVAALRAGAARFPLPRRRPPAKDADHLLGGHAQTQIRPR